MPLIVTPGAWAAGTPLMRTTSGARAGICTSARLLVGAASRRSKPPSGLRVQSVLIRPSTLS